MFVVNKYFFYNFYVFSFCKAREINRHFPCNPRLSKHFLKAKPKLLPNRSSNSRLYFQKITTFLVIIINNLIKTNIKQNFVKEKITVWDFGKYFKLYMVIYVKISMIQNRVLFFLYKKVLRKAGVQRYGVWYLCIKKTNIKILLINR